MAPINAEAVVPSVKF